MRASIVPDGSRARRLAEVVATVALWMGIGWATDASANAYLLVGVPITAGFQLLVRRRPLHALWVRDAPDFRLAARDVALALLLAAAPLYALIRHLASAGRAADWVRATWLVAAAVGAAGAAFALRRLGRGGLRHLAGCLATAGGVGIAIVVAARIAAADDPPLTAGVAVDALRWLLLYVPVAFALEEVFFRGALDSHLHHEGEARSIGTALLSSALWGIWHLPATPVRSSVWTTSGGLVVIHVLVGVPLSIYWRRSRNLAVPGVTHAAIDAARNALLQPPL